MSLAIALQSALGGTGTLGRIQVQKALDTLTRRRIHLISEWDTKSRHYQKQYCGTEIHALDVTIHALSILLKSNDPFQLKHFEQPCFLNHWAFDDQKAKRGAYEVK